MIAKSRASRMVAPITLVHGKDKWTIATRRSAAGSPSACGRIATGPLASADRASVKALSEEVDLKAVDATFYTSKGGGVTGSSPPRPAGSSTSGTITAVRPLLARADRARTSATIVPAAVTKPNLTGGGRWGRPADAPVSS
jgi:hypothetical protein